VSKYYLTTAIDYSNGEPHLGHAFEKVGADVIARYRRARGDDVHFVIGMDEHGQKVAQEAVQLETTPQALVDAMAERFLAAWNELGISYDDFIRTTEPRHREAVEALVAKVREADDFYLGRYTGPYCVGCEAFKKEDELVDGRCPIHPSREIVWTEEENYFFRLSDYRERLLEHIDRHPEFIQPTSRRNEILRLLEGGLEDVSASRQGLPWGVPFPGAEGHTVYVWFDALPNYISAIGFPHEEYEEWWPADLHIIGKDITRFHCVIWPAMLMSAGLELPATVWAHGFVSVGSGKLSKSEGKQLDIHELIDRHGRDALRYYLMREVPWDGDRNFGDQLVELFDERYNSDLANALGNLLNRTVAMIGKYRDGAVPTEGSSVLDEAADEALSEYVAAMDGLLLHQGVETAMSLVRRANAFIDETQPWRLARETGSEAELDTVLGSLARSLVVVAGMFSPIMPDKATELWERLGGRGPVPGFAELTVRAREPLSVHTGPVLFPRAEAVG
jgi:methionyl-tRNA synthetase